MTYTNFSTKEINCKIVYYGPDLSGRSTCLRYLSTLLRPEGRGTMNPPIDRIEDALAGRFFDFSSKNLVLRGFPLRLHLSTASGTQREQRWERALEKADGVVFVADSHPDRIEDNKRARSLLQELLDKLNNPLSRLPYVLQLNKRDLGDALPEEALKQQLVYKNEPVFLSIGRQGQGVKEPLREVVRQLYEQLKAGEAAH